MQKTHEVEDLRVRRSRKMLQQALIELTVEKGFNAVTVRDLTERAMVNRSTFYRHYTDKYDLLEQYMQDVGALTSDDELADEKIGQMAEGEPSGLVRLLRHVQKYGDFYRVMLGQNGDAAFSQRFRQNSEKRFRYLLENFGAEEDPNGPPLDFRLNYVSCAGVGAILWWLENGQPVAVEQMAVWLGQMSSISAGLSLDLHAKAAGSN